MELRGEPAIPSRLRTACVPPLWPTPPYSELITNVLEVVRLPPVKPYPLCRVNAAFRPMARSPEISFVPADCDMDPKSISMERALTTPPLKEYRAQYAVKLRP